MIKLTAKSFLTQKKAEALDDCQDAQCQNERIGRFAVADGATRSFFSKEWAELLVEHFCETHNPFPNACNWREWLRPIQVRWHEKIVQKVRAVPHFFLVNSLNSREPAASTFIGLEFDKVQARWQAMIVGDSCLFHIGSCGFKSYMIEESVDFTSRPEVFASYEMDNHYEPDFVSDDAKPGDTFILATDALAKWILEHEELVRCEKAIGQLKQIQTDNQFQEFVDSSRVDEDITLVNDDVTLMIISVEKDDAQASHQETAECPSVETSELQPEWPPILFWTMIVVFFGLPILFYLCWLLFFSDKD